MKNSVSKNRTKQPAKRIHHAGVLLGRKGTGKSTRLAELAAEYVKRQGRPALIIDVNGSMAYANFQPITLEQLGTWQAVEVRKIYSPNSLEMLTAIKATFKNGLLIAEDCSRYIPPNPPTQVKELITDHRMLGLDVIFTFHALRLVPKYFWTFTNYLILRKTNEHLEPSDRNRYPFYHTLLPAFEKVRAAKSNFAEQVISTDLWAAI